MTEVVLAGCHPEPLMSYLKALGVLRLVAEQQDENARGYWKDSGVFALDTVLDDEQIVQFFLESYSPTPLVAPWGARSGFYKGSSEKAAREALAKLEKGPGERFQSYRMAVESVRSLLARHHIEAKQKDEDKLRLMRLCRQELPDELLQWIDAVYVLSTESRDFPPLLGTGGNEGSGSYVSGFAQQLVEALIDRKWDNAIRAALMGKTESGCTSEQTPGQFSPGAGSGANLSQGFERQAATNPWDYILALEGTCLWASAVARSMRARTGVPVSPFTFVPIAAGNSALSPSDSRKPKAAKRTVREMWVPVWSRPAKYNEIANLIAEGRATVHDRNAANGVDMMEAIAQLGVDRGVQAFHRFLFSMRNGQSFYAAPLGTYQVEARPEVDLLRDIEARGWLARFRRECQREGSPPRFSSALRRFDQAVSDFCRYGGKVRFASILCALGAIECQLSFRHDHPGSISSNGLVTPIPTLSPDWVPACDDGTVEFRIAMALASIRGEGRIGPLRVNMEPVEKKGKGFSWAEKSQALVWSSADLCHNLAAVLARRVMDATRLGIKTLPLHGEPWLDVNDVATFIQGGTDDQRIEDLLWGAVLVGGGARLSLRGLGREGYSLLPRSYSLLRLLFAPDFRTADGAPIHPEPEILGHLTSGDIAGACEKAARRLRASGLVPIAGVTSRESRTRMDFCGNVNPCRLSASLLLPVAGTMYLANMVLRQPKKAIES